MHGLFTYGIFIHKLFKHGLFTNGFPEFLKRNKFKQLTLEKSRTMLFHKIIIQINTIILRSQELKNNQTEC